MGNTETEGLREAKRKKRAGLELSQKELKASRAYSKDHTKLAVKVYMSSGEELDDMKWSAKRDGYTSLSKWMLEKTKEVPSGKVHEAGYVERLQETAFLQE